MYRTPGSRPECALQLGRPLLVLEVDELDSNRQPPFPIVRVEVGFGAVNATQSVFRNAFRIAHFQLRVGAVKATIITH